MDRGERHLTAAICIVVSLSGDPEREHVDTSITLTGRDVLRAGDGRAWCHGMRQSPAPASIAARAAVETTTMRGRLREGAESTLRLWPMIFSGEVDVLPSEGRDMGQEIGR